MAREILMPKLGLTMKTGTVLKWFKDVGDPVAENEPIIEIETEKLSHQIEAPASGVLLQKLATVGEKYPVACVLGYIGSPGERVEAIADGGAPAPEIPSSPTAPTPSAASGGARVFISPVARKLAASLGVDYQAIPGTGPNGRVVKADVERFAGARPAPAVHTDAGADTVIPYTGMRRAIGENMLRSWLNVPMVTHHVMADVTELVQYREKLNSGVNKSEKVTFNDLILKLTATALANYPAVNSSLTDEGIVLYRRVHLGMATAVDGGLVVPVIRNANRKGLLEISREAKNLALRARGGALRAEETAGGTFTVTNLGGYGSVDLFTPIINPPQAAILGVWRVVQAALPVNGEIQIRSTMGLSFTYDHRVIDGAAAAEFMASFLKLLENPARSLLN